MGKPLEVLPELPDRLQAAARAVRDAEKALQLERESRDRLIVEAVDHAGMGQATVARLAGISQPSVVRILARSQPASAAAESAG